MDDDGMADGQSTDVELAECGSCRAQIPIDSGSCPECNTSFSGVTSEELGECGSCGKLVPLDSSSCPECGVNFILDDLVSELRQWLDQKSITVTILFNEVDADGDGVLTGDEVKQALSSRNLSFLGADELDRFLMQIDLDRDGTISFGELAAALMIPMGVSPDDDEPAEAEPEAEIEEAAEAPEEEAAPTVDDYTFSEDVLSKVLEKHDISDREAFLEHAMAFDEDGNQYLKKSELEKAAAAYETPAQAEPEVGDDAEEADEEEADDEAEEEESDAEETDDVDEGEDSDDADEEDDTDSAVVAFTRLIEAVEASSESARGLFEKLDRNESDNVDSDEFKDAVRELMDDDFSDEDLDSIISAMDTDDDGYLDIIEITSALEDPEKVIEEIEKPKREGPAAWQLFLMRHYENVFPVAYVLFAIFIGIWLVNGLVGPVDGSLGPVKFDGDSGPVIDGTEIMNGDVYPCDKQFQESGCKNSLTPLSGDSTSMPKGFYWDGVMFMVLGSLTIVGTILLQRQTKGWRIEHRKKRDGEDEEEDDEEDEEQDAVADDEADEAEADQDSDDDDVDDDDNDDDDDDDDDSEDEIDVGSKVGVEHDGKEFKGTIVEFDDEEDEVLVRRNDDDEEVWVPFDSLFLE
jgi:Ca2+-binding EF-hand superfamily protein/RNA polymerase subunit RPABC4/transcription elongation factor Spt4